jgi:hypothetical protein
MMNDPSDINVGWEKRDIWKSSHLMINVLGKLLLMESTCEYVFERTGDLFHYQLSF